MLYILLSVICSVIIANLLMLFGKTGKHHILPIFLGNYLMAAVSSYLAIPRGAAPPGTFDLILGVVSGLFFLVNFLAYQRNIIANGLSLSVSVMRIAMILPILVSLVIFRERINAFNGIGILLALSAFLLKSEWGGLHNLLWLVWLFLISGATDLTLKLFKELGSGAEQTYVFIIFVSAFCFTLLAIRLKKLPLSWTALLFGLLLGIPNRLSTVFFLKGLSSVAAAIAYPLAAIGIVLLSLCSDILFWKRRLAARELVMYLALVGSLILLNI